MMAAIAAKVHEHCAENETEAYHMYINTIKNIGDCLTRDSRLKIITEEMGIKPTFIQISEETIAKIIQEVQAASCEIFKFRGIKHD